jgi:hypothetical protein
VNDVEVFQCQDVPEQIPGSNLYFACWLCMLSSMGIAFKWKAAQALKFAEAERQQQKEQVGQEIDDDDDDDNDDADQ